MARLKTMYEQWVEANQRAFHRPRGGGGGGGGGGSHYDYGDRSALEHQKYQNQAALIAQRQAAQQSHVQPLSQSERLQMARLQNGMAAVDQARRLGVISGEDANAMLLQINTGLNPYQLKQQRWQAEMAKAKYAQFLDDAQVQAQANALHATAMQQAGNNGLLTVDDPNNPGKKLVMSFDQHGKATLLHSGKDAAAGKEKKYEDTIFPAHKLRPIAEDVAESKMQKKYPWFDLKAVKAKAAGTGKDYDKNAVDLLGEYNGILSDEMAKHEEAWKDHQRRGEGGDFPEAAPDRSQYSGGGGDTGEPASAPLPPVITSPYGGAMTGAAIGGVAPGTFPAQRGAEVTDRELRDHLGITPPDEE